MSHAGRLAQRPERGRRAEDLAADHLESKGFRILVRNWRRPEGEIDIFAEDGDTRVFVEVRSRTGEDSGHPLEMLTARKRAQVIRTARLFLMEENLPEGAAYRFDVVGVTFSAETNEATLVHVPNAFETDE